MNAECRMQNGGKSFSSLFDFNEAIFPNCDLMSGGSVNGVIGG